MATQDAWNDWEALRDRCAEFNGLIQVQLKNNIVQLQSLQSEILQNEDRKEALKPIANEHPVWKIADLNQLINKATNLDEWLTNHSFY